MAKEDYMMKLMALEQDANKFQQQAELIDQQVLEIQTIQNCLEQLDKTTEKLMFASLGKNIFIKAEIQDKTLFMDVGNRTFVKKSIPETLNIVEEQLIKLGEAKSSMLAKMQSIQQEMEQIVMEAQTIKEE